MEAPRQKESQARPSRKPRGRPRREKNRHQTTVPQQHSSSSPPPRAFRALRSKKVHDEPSLRADARAAVVAALIAPPEQRPHPAHDEQQGACDGCRSPENPPFSSHPQSPPGHIWSSAADTRNTDQRISLPDRRASSVCNSNKELALRGKTQKPEQPNEDDEPKKKFAELLACWKKKGSRIERDTNTQVGRTGAYSIPTSERNNPPPKELLQHNNYLAVNDTPSPTPLMMSGSTKSSRRRSKKGDNVTSTARTSNALDTSVLGHESTQDIWANKHAGVLRSRDTREQPIRECSATWRKGQEQITSGALYDRRPRHDRADRAKSDEYDPLPRGNRSHRAKGKLLTEDLSISIGLTADCI